MPDKKTITIDCRMIDNSGIGTYLKNILNYAVSESKYKWVLLGKQNKIKEHVKGEYQIVEVCSKIYSIREQFEMLRKIPKSELLWCPHYNIPLFYKDRMVVTIHDICHLALPEYFPGYIKQVYAKQLIGSAVRKSEAVITDSKFTASEIQKYFRFDRAKLKIIPLGVGNAYNTDSSGDTLFLKKHGIQNPYILYVGNIKPHKNISRYIKALGLIKKKNKNLSFVFVGKKEGFISGMEDLEQELEHAGIEDTVFIDERLTDIQLKTVYQEALCLAFPSMYEGFGLPPLEAMACGCPVVVSKAASLPEVCGDAAVYIDPYSVESIAEGINTVLLDENLRAELRLKGIKRARMFEWQDTAKKFIEIFQEAIDK